MFFMDGVDYYVSPFLEYLIVNFVVSVVVDNFLWLDSLFSERVPD